MSSQFGSEWSNGGVSDDLLPEAFAFVFRSSSLGMCIVNHEFRYVEVNPALCSMLGYGRQELLETNFLEITHPEDRKADRDRSVELFEGKLPYFEIEKRWIRADGSVLSGNLIASVLHKDGDDPSGIALINEIPSEGAQRDPLAVSTAHDLNNLLTVIRGSADSLEAEYGSSEEFEVIEAAVGRASSLSQGLLLAAKTGAKIRTGVNAVVTRFGLVLDRLLPKGVSLASELPGEELFVALTPLQLDQVLMNLVVNARDAVDGEGAVEIKISKTPDSARIDVCDTGTGIPEAVQDRIFEPFFTTKVTGRGTGMGLAIVHSLVTGAGGELEVESRTGEGATVRVLLPRFEL